MYVYVHTMTCIHVHSCMDTETYDTYNFIRTHAQTHMHAHFFWSPSPQKGVGQVPGHSLKSCFASQVCQKGELVS